MARSPLVSVIIPAFNAEAYIQRTLRSVLSQTYVHLEAIVIDDGSTDGTTRIAEAAADRDPRVRLLTQRNQGVAAARNAGIAAARGDYIAPIDADDVWFPRKLERQVRCLERADDSVGLAYTWWVSIDEEGNIIGAATPWDVEGYVLEPLIFVNFIGNASIPLIRRSCLEQVGGYDTTLHAQGGQGCEDWHLMLRIAEHYAFRVVPAYLVGYRKARNSMSRDCTAMARSYELVMSDIRQRHPSVQDSCFRWSRSYFYRYLMSTCYNSGHVRGAIHWAAHAVRNDPSAALAPGTVLTMMKSAVRYAASPLTSLIWPTREDWLQFKEKIGLGRTNHGPVLSGTSSPEIDESRLPWTWKPWKPYDRICLRRWRSLTTGSRQCPPPIPHAHPRNDTVEHA